MNLLKKVVLTTSTLLVLTSCSTTQPAASNLQAKLTDWMQGHFTSEAQSKTDKDFFNIHLNMKQIWPQRTDATWLYVEQAAFGYLDKPYRQRVYKVIELSEGHFSSQVLTLENPLSYAGAYATPQQFSSLTPSDLTVKQGCTVYLTWNDNSQTFAGSTKEKECLSSLRGATYATSEVIISKDSILSWDRGFDTDNKHIWGAIKSGYIFDQK